MSLNKNKVCFYFIIFFNCYCFSQIKNSDSVNIQSDIQNLKAVVVTATKTERQLYSLPLPVQIISKNEIKRNNAVRLGDILNEQTGLVTIPDFGGGEGIQMQGLDSQYTLILIDDVPLIGRFAGTLDISRISVGNIKQIEIVKGASSSLYGSEALGGVINIITEKPKEGFDIDTHYRYGSLNAQDLGANMNFKKHKLSTNVFLNRYSSDGYDLNDQTYQKTVDPFTNYTFQTKIGYDFSENTNALVSARYYTQNQDYIPNENLKGENTINEWNIRAKTNHTFNNKWKSSLEFYATQYKVNEYLNDVHTNILASESYFDQRFIRPEIRTDFIPNKKNHFVLGIGHTYESLNRTDFLKKPQFNAPYIYFQYDTHPSKKTNIILGARFDNHSEYQSQFSPKAAIRYKLTDKISLKGSIGYGFKAPDFRQLYFNFTNNSVGYTVLGYNAVTTVIAELEERGEIERIVVPFSEFENKLNAENSISYNLGGSFNPTATLKLDLNLFRNNINDLIDTRVIANKTNSQNVFSYYNISKVYTQGAEFNALWSVNNQISIKGGYQLLYAKDKDAEKAFKNREVYARQTPSSPSFALKKSDYFGLYNRSRHMANIKLSYTSPKLKFNTNLRGTYRSKYGLFDSNNNLYLDKYDEFVEGYTIWDIAINKTFYKNYVLGIGVDNVFGFKDTQNISNISGRLFYAKLNFNF